MEHLLLDSILMVLQYHAIQKVRFIQLPAARGMHCRGTSVHLSDTGWGGGSFSQGQAYAIGFSGGMREVAIKFLLMLSRVGAAQQLVVSMVFVQEARRVKWGFGCHWGKQQLTQKKVLVIVQLPCVILEMSFQTCHTRNIVLGWPWPCLIGNTIEIPLGNIIAQLLAGRTFTFSLIITIMSWSINPTIQARSNK